MPQPMPADSAKDSPPAAGILALPVRMHAWRISAYDAGTDNLDACQTAACETEATAIFNRLGARHPHHRILMEGEGTLAGTNHTATLRLERPAPARPQPETIPIHLAHNLPPGTRFFHVHPGSDRRIAVAEAQRNKVSNPFHAANLYRLDLLDSPFLRRVASLTGVDLFTGMRVVRKQVQKEAVAARLNVCRRMGGRTYILLGAVLPRGAGADGTDDRVGLFLEHLDDQDETPVGQRHAGSRTGTGGFIMGTLLVAADRIEHMDPDRVDRAVAAGIADCEHYLNGAVRAVVMQQCTVPIGPCGAEFRDLDIQYVLGDDRAREKVWACCHPNGDESGEEGGASTDLGPGWIAGGRVANAD